MRGRKTKVSESLPRLPGVEEVAPVWPGVSSGQRVVFLLDTASGFEEALLRRWIADETPKDAGPVETLSIPGSRRGRGKLDPRLVKLLPQLRRGFALVLRVRSATT